MKILKNLVWLVSFLTVASPMAAYFYITFQKPEKSTVLSEFGSYVGGFYGPILSGIGLILLVLQIKSQSKQLKMQAKQFKKEMEYRKIVDTKIVIKESLISIQKLLDKTIFGRYPKEKIEGEITFKDFLLSFKDNSKYFENNKDSRKYPIAVFKESKTLSLWITVRIALFELDLISSNHHIVMLSHIWDELGSDVIDPLQELIESVPGLNSLKPLNKKLLQPY